MRIVTKNKKEDSNNKNDLSSFLLMFWMSLFFLLVFARFLLARVGLTSGLIRELILWSITFIPLVIFIININKFKLAKYLHFYIVFFSLLIAMLISLIANPDLYEFYFRKNYGIDRILRPDSAIFALLFFQLFDNQKDIIDLLVKYSVFYFLFLIVVDLIPSIIRGYWQDIGANGKQIKLMYSLSFGYNLAFPTIMFIYNYVVRKRNTYLFGSIIGSLLVLIYGNRGAILVLLIYILLLIIGYIRPLKPIRKFIILALLSIAIVLLIYFSDMITNNFIRWLNNHDLNSRNINLIISGKISNDNGRKVIWDTVIRAIEKGGIFGYGVLGDRPFVTPIHYVGYSHNIFLELVASFGILGYIFIIYIIIDSVYMIFHCKDKDSYDLFIILFALSCQLLLSMSLWYTWEFWAAIAVSRNYKKLLNDKNKSVMR